MALIKSVLVCKSSSMNYYLRPAIPHQPPSVINGLFYSMNLTSSLVISTLNKSYHGSGGGQIIV